MASHVRPPTPPNGVHPHHNMAPQHGVHVNGMPNAVQQQPPPGPAGPPGPPPPPQQQQQQQPPKSVTSGHLAQANEAVWVGIGMETDRTKWMDVANEAQETSRS
jgi:hypothetical protein